MKKGLERFLLLILALFLTYQVYDFFWERNREKKIERVIVAMQNSVDELEGFLRQNQDDLEYLVTRCVEDDIVIYKDTVYSIKGPGNPKEIVAEQEVLSRRDRLLANLPSNMDFFHIYSSGISLYVKDAILESLHIEISSPPFTQGSSGRVVGSIGTIELNRIWTINVVTHTHSHSDYVRTCKVLERMKNEQNKN